MVRVYERVWEVGEDTHQIEDFIGKHRSMSKPWWRQRSSHVVSRTAAVTVTDDRLTGAYGAEGGSWSECLAGHCCGHDELRKGWKLS